MNNYKKICAFCGETFLSQRKDAKTCSNTCRVYLYKLNSGLYEYEKRLEMTNNNVTNVSETLKKEIEFAKLKQFLLHHKKAIQKLAIELEIRTEDEYEEIAVIATQASDLLNDIEENCDIDPFYIDKIQEVDMLYEQHLDY